MPSTKLRFRACELDADGFVSAEPAIGFVWNASQWSC